MDVLPRLLPQRSALPTTPSNVLWILLFIAAWFSLSSTLSVMLAALDGKNIEIVVCSGAGIKKISVPTQDGSEVVPTFKHCANAPLLACLVLPGAPVHLQLEAPHTVASWSWTPEPPTARDLLRESRPPPGRAPPVTRL